MTLFLLSAAFASIVCVVAAWTLAERRDDVYWILVASLALQLGALATLLTIARRLSPAWWVGAHAVLAITALAISRTAAGMRRMRRHCLERPNLPNATGRSAVTLLLVVGVAIMTFETLIAQAATPIDGFDERMYHASRVLYWIQQGAILPYATHNDRQTVFTFGSELFFLWPVLLSRSELLARVVFWVGVPAALAACYAVCRALRVPITGSLAAAFTLSATPIVARAAVGLKPDMWSMVFLLSAAYWAVRLCLDPQKPALASFFLPLTVCLAINVRLTNLPAVAGALMLPFLIRSDWSRARRARMAVAGLLTGVVWSGFGLLVATNLSQHGHPFGPAGMRAVHASDLSPQQVRTHLIRGAVSTIELPFVPDPVLRARIDALVSDVVTKLGARKALRQERADQWPGAFSFHQAERAKFYSLPGLVCALALLWGAGGLVQNVFGAAPGAKLSAVSAIVLLIAPVIAASLIAVRWMAASDVPLRLLIGPFGVAVCVGAAMLLPVAKRRPFVRALLLLVIMASAYWPMHDGAARAENAVTSRFGEPGALDEPARALGCGARVLFIGFQNAPDYTLFNPQEGYCNEVLPWGKGAFDGPSVERIVEQRAVTHILIQDDHYVTFHWAGGLATDGFVAWAREQTTFVEVPLTAPRMRLFKRGSPTAVSPIRETRAVVVPVAAPLVIVRSSAAGDLQVDESQLHSPWPVEDLGAPEAGFLWLGSKKEEGCELVVRTGRPLVVNLQVDISGGLSLRGGSRVIVEVDGKPLGPPQVVSARRVLDYRIQLPAGPTTVRLYSPDERTIPVQPNGDRRSLMLGLHEVRLTVLERS